MIKQTLSALPSAQFDDLVFALNPPKGNIPGNQASQSSRTTALLEWVESPIGPGLSAIDGLLSKTIAITSKTSEQFVAFSISGKISESTMLEVQAFVKLLRKKTGDNSIDVAFFKEGSIEMILMVSPKGLQKLQALFVSGKLVKIGSTPVAFIDYVDNNTGDARKTRLVQALRLGNKSDLALDLALDRARDRDRARDLIRDRDLIRARDLIHNLLRDLTRDLDRARDLIHDLDLIRDLDLTQASGLDRDFDLTRASTLTRARARARDLILDLTQAFDLVRALDRALDLDLTRAFVRASFPTLALANALDSTLDRARDSALDLDLIRDRASAITRNQQLNLERADLTNTNLRNVNFRVANLTEANFTRADLTGADLTGANFTGTVLTGVIFTDANVTETVFGENEGLTDADKLDLQRRGAILLDPPSSDVTSLVLR